MEICDYLMLGLSKVVCGGRGANIYVQEGGGVYHIQKIYLSGVL